MKEINKINEWVKNKISKLSELELNDEKQMINNIKIFMEEIIEAYDRINSIDLNFKKLRRNKNESSNSLDLWGTSLLMNSMSLGGKSIHNETIKTPKITQSLIQIKRNLALKVRNEEREKHEKEQQKLADYFKTETLKLQNQFINQRQELIRRTSQITRIARFLILQEHYISGIARIVYDNFEKGNIIRKDDGLSFETNQILRDGNPDTHLASDKVKFL